MTKKEYIEKTIRDFAESHPENQPVFVEDEIMKFIAMIEYMDGEKSLLVVDLLPPFDHTRLESMPKDEAIAYCNAISTKVFHMIPPIISDPRTEDLETFFSAYDAYCKSREKEVREFLSKVPGKSVSLPGLQDNLYRTHSLGNRLFIVCKAAIYEDELKIVVSPTDSELPELIGFDEVSENPELMHDLMWEFYRVTE